MAIYYTISFSYAIKIHLKTFGVQINIYIWAKDFYDKHHALEKNNSNA